MLIIIGTGHAGYTLAREFRKLDRATPLTLVTRDDGHSYYKPDISKAFASGKDADGLIKARVEQMASELNARVLVGTEVVAIDPAAHRIRMEESPLWERAMPATDRGALWERPMAATGRGHGALPQESALEYSKLVLASGATPIRIPIAGDAAAQVFSVNSRVDYARFRDGLASGARVLIIGAGLIGCEWANDMGANGFRVSVVDIASWPLPRLLPEACGRALRGALAALGVQWYLKNSVKSLDANGAGLRATLADGTQLEVDRVLSAVGLRADLSLASAAGLACKQGIVVDSMLKTSADDIYALGDCIEIGGRLLPFILPISHAARALGATLAGNPTAVKFPAMPVQVKTPACPVIVCPPPTLDGSWALSGETPNLEAVFIDAAGKPSGFALTGSATARRGALAATMPAVTI